MTRVSYAQNFEDVILHRVLSDVDIGFYIDVGANDPYHHSVTKRFYDIGWRGINIEPSKAYFDKLKLERPRDINLRLVVSNKDGFSRFFEIAGTGISTTEKDVSDVHHVNGHPVVERKIKALTLSTICATHAKNTVHFLKIDVEGGTKSVLEGLDLAVVRPWILVVEATKPNTQIEDAEEWEHLILSQAYEFVYADGLNRFYLAAEHAELRPRFRYPPNVFDDFLPSAHQLAAVVRAQDNWGKAAEARIAELAVEKAAVEDALAEEVARTRMAEALLEQRRDELAAVLQAHDQWGQAAEARIALLERENLALTSSLAEQTERAGISDALAAAREAALRRVAASVSWRITRPLRGWKKGERGGLPGL